jgi:hypothetical protein
VCITGEEETQKQRSGRSVFAGRQERHWAGPPKPGNHEPRPKFVTVLSPRKAVVEKRQAQRTHGENSENGGKPGIERSGYTGWRTGREEDGGETGKEGRQEAGPKDPDF